MIICRFSVVIHVLLVCAVLVTSQAMAVARGANGPAGQMVLCLGGQAVVVLVDRDGQPVERAHLCPDCTLSVLDHVAAAHGAVKPCDLRATPARVRADLARSVFEGPARLARGPPARG